MFCHKCGVQNLEGAAFCQKCGEKLIKNEAEQQAPANSTSMSAPLPTVSVENVSPAVKKKKLNWFTGGLLLVAIAAVIVIIIASLGGDDSAITTSGTVGTSNRYVQMVRDGSPYFSPNVTYGAAFSDFFANPRWIHFKSDEGVDIVEFTGECTYQGVQVKALLQFAIDEANGTFEPLYLDSNDVPQTMLVMAALIETAFNEFVSDSSSSQTTTPANNAVDASGDRIVIGETQTFNDEYIGNMEVTLEYVEFVDSVQHDYTGEYLFPDENHVFLRAEFTLKNIGTKSGDLLTAWTKVVYDGAYEFGIFTMGGHTHDINPLTTATGSLTFMVPTIVAESDNSLAINFGDGEGRAVMSFAIRGGDGGTQTSQGSTALLFGEGSDSDSATSNAGEQGAALMDGWTTQSVTSDGFGVSITVNLPAEWSMFVDPQPWGDNIVIEHYALSLLEITDVFAGMGSTEALVASGISSQAFMFDNMEPGYMIEFEDSIVWAPTDSWIEITFNLERHRDYYLAYEEIINAVARSFSWN